MRETEFRFNVLICERDSKYIAYCLEMGLVAVGDRPDDLPAIMFKMVGRQLEFALKNNNPSDIYHPAPPEVWEMFHAASKKQSVKEIEGNQRSMWDWPGVRFNQVSYGAYC